MKWTCIDVRTYNDNQNGTKTFGEFKINKLIDNFNDDFLRLNYFILIQKLSKY